MNPAPSLSLLAAERGNPKTARKVLYVGSSDEKRLPERPRDKGAVN